MQRFLQSTIGSLEKMAFTANEVAEMFGAGESVLDEFCMEDSDDDLGMDENVGGYDYDFEEMEGK